jgi:hypothetical protein
MKSAEYYCYVVLAVVGLCTLNEVDPDPIACNLSNPYPINYQVKKTGFKKFAFQIQLAALHRGGAVQVHPHLESAMVSTLEPVK